MMGLLLQQGCLNRCHISLPKNYPYMTNDTGIETHTSESPIVAKANTVVILR